MNRASRAGEAGFTLIELLVALVLVAFLTTLVFGGLRLAVRAWAKTHEGVAEAADLWAVENVLRQAIKQGDLAKSTTPGPLAEFILNSYEGALVRMKAEQDSRPLKNFLRFTFDVVLKK